MAEVVSKLRLPVQIGDTPIGTIEVDLVLEVTTTADASSIVIAPRIDGAQLAGQLGEALTVAGATLRQQATR